MRISLEISAKGQGWDESKHGRLRRGQGYRERGQPRSQRGRKKVFKYAFLMASVLAAVMFVWVKGAQAYDLKGSCCVSNSGEMAIVYEDENYTAEQLCKAVNGGRVYTVIPLSECN